MICRRCYGKLGIEIRHTSFCDDAQTWKERCFVLRVGVNVTASVEQGAESAVCIEKVDNSIALHFFSQNLLSDGNHRGQDINRARRQQWTLTTVP